jgi:hypothetical protein
MAFVVVRWHNRVGTVNLVTLVAVGAVVVAGSVTVYLRLLIQVYRLALAEVVPVVVKPYVAEIVDMVVTVVEECG